MMNSNSAKRANSAVVLGLLLASVLAYLVFHFAGCTNTLDGELDENVRPIVYFVNIPPEGQSFSRNPVVYWYGTDTDGLIDYYRYHVATQNEIGSMTLDDYILTLSDEISITCDTVFDSPSPGDTVIVCDTISDWDYVDVDPVAANPQTAVSVSLTADPTNPVRNFVSQWVFLQAFDLDGAASDIVYRLFKRNDNPPQTLLYGIPPNDTPFVNSPTPGGIITGIRLRWEGSDPIDYPQDPPPFEFQWRLYGPYTNAELEKMRNTYGFFTEVFVTTDGFVYRIGDTLIRCDTTLIDGEPEESCDTLLIDPDNNLSGTLGTWERYFRVDDNDFVLSDFNRVIDSSWDGLDSWVLEQTDTIYNVYRNFDTDTTLLMNFVFWVRSRDDALVADLAPAFTTGVKVLEPRFERDVGVLDWRNKLGCNPTKPSGTFNTENFWKEVVEGWGSRNIDGGVEFDISRDYLSTPVYSGRGLPLDFLLKHKIIICYNEGIKGTEISTAEMGGVLFKAIDAGVNVWATWRAPLVGQCGSSPNPSVVVPFNYGFYFAVSGMVSPGWTCHAIDIGLPDRNCQLFRSEDFVGAHSLRPNRWPDLDIDSLAVATRYNWEPVALGIGFDDTLPCLPEVGWSEAGLGAEIMYLYKSIHGADHPLGSTDQFDYIMEGTPVAHRFNPTLFRTVHFSFTITSLSEEPGNSTGGSTSQRDAIADTVLNWLYDPSIAAAVSGERYPDAPVKLSVSEQRKRYWEQNDQWAREAGFVIDPKLREDE